MFYYERKLNKQGYDIIIGIDEAGRGPLAGPVVAAAVALKTRRFKTRIDDSKKLKPRQREAAYLEIVAKAFYGIGAADHNFIDKYNILVATRMAMRQALREVISKLDKPGEKRIHVIVDGNVGLDINYPVTHIIRGDSKSCSIAAASILAKVTRDRIMSFYHIIYPQYNFLQHKGYPTRSHRDAIRRHGTCLIHRSTFCCV